MVGERYVSGVGGGSRSACDIKGVLFDYICLFRSKDIQQDWKYKDEYDLEIEIQVTLRKKKNIRETRGEAITGTILETKQNDS